MTKVELAAWLVNQKAGKDLSAVVWNDIVLAAQGLPLEQKSAIVESVRERRADFGRILVEAVLTRLRVQAETAVSQALADDTLTVAELTSLIP